MSFGSEASAPGYRQMGLQLSGPPANNSPSRAFSLGQVEGTSAHGGCDGNGTSAHALPLARNGLQMPLTASKVSSQRAICLLPRDLVLTDCCCIGTVSHRHPLGLLR